MTRLSILVVGILIALFTGAQDISYNTTTVYDTDWEYVGPASDIQYSYTNAPGLGLVDAITMLPSNNNIKFASSNTSGLYKTVDNGLSWYSVTDDLNRAGMGISSITFDPNDDSRMVATTGGMSNNLGGFSDGLLYSENQGDNWICINVPNVNWANHNLESSKTSIVKFDPFDSNKLLIGGHRSIWYSDDLGQSWTEVNDWDISLASNGYLQDPNEEWYIADIEYHPSIPGEVYASSTSFSGEGYAFILKSADGGLNWQRL